MNIAALFLAPVFILVGLTLAMLVWSTIVRGRVIRSGQVNFAGIGLREAVWPAETLKISNNYQNLLELPILYYAWAVLTLVTGAMSPLMLFISWGFVLSRLVHTGVHVTSNFVPLRGGVFAIGVSILVTGWIVLWWRIAGWG